MLNCSSDYQKPIGNCVKLVLGLWMTMFGLAFHTMLKIIDDNVWTCLSHNVEDYG